MTPEHDRIVETYTAASDHFDALPFWHHFGRRTVERLHLSPGARVLDICCGTGASALRAAEDVGPAGHVLAVDLTPALIQQGERHARARGLRNVEFRAAAVESLEFPAESFDALVCLFGIFFLDDMPGMLSRAFTWLRPGGVLAVTVWGRTVLAPGEELFWDAVLAEDPAMEAVSPSDLLAEPAALAKVFDDAGIQGVQIESETWEMPIARPEDFWPVILGTSNRGALEALSPAARERVRTRVLEELRARGTQALISEVNLAQVRKGAERSARVRTGP